VSVLKGHTAAVWAVLSLPSGDILTASADKTIKIWRDYKCIKTLTKHTDCVRGLALVPSVGFLSCGNDGYVCTLLFL
jgi:phospholipase A-2-activating protein